MYTVIKTLEIAGAHTLNLPYDSPCGRLHGHNWTVEVEVRSENLNAEGMVIDFTIISEVVRQLDHAQLNNVQCPHCKEITPGILPQGLNPTAENIARWIATKLTLLIEEKLKKDVAERLLKEEGTKVDVVAAYLDGEPDENDTIIEASFEDIVDEQMDSTPRPRISKVVVVEASGNTACYTP